MSMGGTMVVDYGEKRVKMEGEFSIAPAVFCANECYTIDREYPYNETAIDCEEEEFPGIVSYCEKLFKTKIVLKRRLSDFSIATVSES